MTDTLAALEALNTRTVTLLQRGDEVHAVEPETPGSITFKLARVPARDIRTNLLFAVLGRDGFVQYANWFNAQAQQARAQAEVRKPGEHEPFDDSLPDDAQWRAHTMALEDAAEDAVLARGMITPSFAETGHALGPMGAVLVREIVQWGREAPEDPNSPSASSEPP